MAELLIAGSRGIPASYGGFETLAAEVAPNLTNYFAQVIVTGFSQTQPTKFELTTIENGKIVAISVKSRGWVRLQNLRYTLIAVRYAKRNYQVSHALVLNDVNFLAALYLKLSGVKTVLHLDGDEASRRGIPLPGRLLHRLFRAAAVRLLDLLIIDSHALKAQLPRRQARKVAVIKYGATTELISKAELQAATGITGEYLLVIARMVPENNLVEMVQAILTADLQLPVQIFGLGTGSERYQAELIKLAAAKPTKIKLHQARYESALVNSLLHFCTAYLHGHQAGGTNPILVSARAHAPLILAHNNPFNQEGATQLELFWKDQAELNELLRTQLVSAVSAAKLLPANPNREQPSWATIGDQIAELFQNDNLAHQKAVEK